MNYIRHFQIDPNAITGMVEIHAATPELVQAFCYAVVNNLPVDINQLVSSSGGANFSIPPVEIDSLEIVNDFERISTFGGSSIDYLPLGKKVRIEFHKKG